MIRTSFNKSGSSNIAMCQNKITASLGYSKKPDNEEYEQGGSGKISDAYNKAKTIFTNPTKIFYPSPDIVNGSGFWGKTIL